MILPAKKKKKEKKSEAEKKQTINCFALVGKMFKGWHSFMRYNNNILVKQIKRVHVL